MHIVFVEICSYYIVSCIISLLIIINQLNFQSILVGLVLLFGVQLLSSFFAEDASLSNSDELRKEAMMKRIEREAKLQIVASH